MSQGEITALSQNYEQIVLDAMRCDVSIDTKRQRQQVLYEATLALEQAGVDAFGIYDEIWQREVGRSDLQWKRP